MASESPFDRHGEAEDSAKATLHPLVFTGRETPYQIAHIRAGDWREWRRFVEVSEVENPFDVPGKTNRQGDETSTFLDIDEPVAGSVPGPWIDFADIDLLTTLNLYPKILDVSGEFPGRIFVQVEDVTDGQYDVNAIDITDFDSWTVAQDKTDNTGEIFVVYDEQIDENETFNISLVMPDGSHMLWEVTQDFWLALWLARSLQIDFVLRPLRTEVIVPRLELVAGRGE